MPSFHEPVGRPGAGEYEPQLGPLAWKCPDCPVVLASIVPGDQVSDGREGPAAHQPDPFVADQWPQSSAQRGGHVAAPGPVGFVLACPRSQGLQIRRATGSVGRRGLVLRIDHADSVLQSVGHPLKGLTEPFASLFEGSDESVAAVEPLTESERKRSRSLTSGLHDCIVGPHRREGRGRRTGYIRDPDGKPGDPFAPNDRPVHPLDGRWLGLGVGAEAVGVYAHGLSVDLAEPGSIQRLHGDEEQAELYVHELDA
jgi:hypothetical protein